MNTSFDHKDTPKNQRHSQHESQSAKTHPSRTIVHAKLEMTEPGDHDEQEADAMADAVVSGGKISRKISSGASGSSGIALSQQMESQLLQLQGGGRQMPQGLLNMMESGFGQDFSQVRLHTDSEAATMSSSINAKAFTHGNDIYFNRGQFSPETTEGQRLVAHELTHVVQGTGKVGRWENPQLKYEKDLAKALEGNYSQVLGRLLGFYGFKLDEYRKTAVAKAYFYAIENDKWYTTIKGMFKDYLESNYRYEIPQSQRNKIADAFDEHNLFEDDYKKAIRIAYDKALRERITTYHDENTETYKHKDDKWVAAARRLRDEKFEQAAKTSSQRGTESQLDRVEAAIALRHYNAMVDPNSYFTTPDFLISGETWTNIFLATVAAELAVVAGPLAASFAAAFGGGATATLVSTAIVNGTIDGLKTAAGEINANYYAKKEEDKKSTTHIIIKSISSGIASALTAGLSTKFPIKSHEYLTDAIYSAIGDVLSGAITQAESLIVKGEVDYTELAKSFISLIEHILLKLLLRKLGDLGDGDAPNLTKNELEKLNDSLNEGAVDVGGILTAGGDLANTIAEELATN